MNKYLISEAGAQLGVYFVERHNGFTAAPHQEPMIAFQMNGIQWGTALPMTWHLRLYIS
jgi:hypothetical protein